MTTLIPRLPDRPMASPIVAIGNFDGLHRWHQAIIARAVGRALEVGGTSVVLTFDPHPVTVLRPETPFPLLSTLDQKVELMAGLGVDLVCALPFTIEFSRRSAEQFVREDLGERLGAREVYVGRNFAFWKGREGGVEELQRFGESFGMRVVIQPPVLVGETMVSSSTIRRLLREGAVAEAAGLLGRPYATDGAVAHGEGRAVFTGNDPSVTLHEGLVALRYVDHYGHATQEYPFNPNGSPLGITGLSNRDGRFTILMPHPERVFRTVQNSWHPADWGEDGPWLRLFRNARKWCG